MKNFVQPGEKITLIAPTDGVIGGQGYLIGSLFVVAESTVDETLPFVGINEGVVELIKATGGAWTQGQKLFWDNTAKKVTHVASANTPVGVAAEAVGSSVALGKVLLDGAAAPSLDFTPAANVAALAGTLTGTVDGTIANVADIALSTSNTYTDAAVNTAVNTAILSMNLQLKELQTTLNAEIAALKSAGLQASS